MRHHRTGYLTRWNGDDLLAEVVECAGFVLIIQADGDRLEHPIGRDHEDVIVTHKLVGLPARSRIPAKDRCVRIGLRDNGIRRINDVAIAGVNEDAVIALGRGPGLPV